MPLILVMYILQSELKALWVRQSIPYRFSSAAEIVNIVIFQSSSNMTIINFVHPGLRANLTISTCIAEMYADFAA